MFILRLFNFLNIFSNLWNLNGFLLFLHIREKLENARNKKNLFSKIAPKNSSNKNFLYLKFWIKKSERSENFRGIFFTKIRYPDW